MLHPGLRLDPSAIERILAPFARIDGLRVSLQDDEGRTVAGAEVDPGSGEPRLTRDLRSDGTTVGRLVAEGRAVTDRTVAATLEALAVSLEEPALATGSPDARRASDTVTADRRSGIAAELSLSRLQQRSIVSLVAPDVPGYDLASHYEPAREIGGDFFELFRLRRRGEPLGFVIADVAGKGIAAALLMAFARPIIHSALTAATGPADALERTNRILVDEIHTALFITALVGRLEPASGRVRIANAGHEPAFVVPGDGGALREVEPGGPLLGAFSPLDVRETRITLVQGDRLVLYTDGVTDSQAPSGERFGRDRLIDTIERHRGGSAHDLVAAIRDAEGSFRSTAACADDVTIVAIGRHAPA
jgi:sigma-B regulation protein RsbU (phosphoserine phosphatase)